MPHGSCRAAYRREAFLKTTIKDIAQACGVSVGLVSRILNEDKTLRCAPETREKVLREIERTAYIPNYNARQLANYSVKADSDIRIGYITYKGAVMKMNSYFDRIIEGVTTILINSKYQVYRYYIDEVHELYRKKQPLCEKKLDGLILFGSIEDDGLVRWLQRQSKYISSIYGDIIENADFVGSDLESTINLMVDYIAKLGYEEMGVVSGDKNRVPALCAYAESIGLRLSEEYSFNAGNEMTRAYDMMKERLESGAVPPKVMCCMNDEMALGVMNAALDAGLRVPEDISVTGHDDILKSNYSRVPLTTVRIYKEEIGRLVTDLLLERINYKRKFPVRLLVPCELVIRRSIQKNGKETRREDE